MVSAFHLAIDGLGRHVLGPRIGYDAAAHWGNRAMMFFYSLYSVHYGAWRLAVVGSVIAGTVTGFAAINAAVDELLLLRGHGSSRELHWASENKLRITEVARRLDAEMETLSRTLNAAGRPPLGRAACSGPGVWSKRCVGARLEEKLEASRHVHRAEQEVSLSISLVRELADKRALSSRLMGKVLRRSTVGLSVLGLYRLCSIVIGVISTSPLSLQRFPYINLMQPNVSGSISHVYPGDELYSLVPGSVGLTELVHVPGLDHNADRRGLSPAAIAIPIPPPTSGIDTVLSWVRQERWIHRWYPEISFVVLGGLGEIAT